MNWKYLLHFGISEFRLIERKSSFLFINRFQLTKSNYKAKIYRLVQFFLLSFTTKRNKVVNLLIEMIAQVFLRRTQTEQLKPTVITIPFDKCKCCHFSYFCDQNRSQTEIYWQKNEPEPNQTLYYSRVRNIFKIIENFIFIVLKKLLSFFY
jgi:hypothetical protein